MKLVMCFLIIFNGLSAYSKDPSVSLIRTKFHHSTTSEKSCKDLINLLEPYTANNNPLFLGYKGGATMLMAKYAINPFNKFSYFTKGRNMLEKAIEADEKNVELRFLRYSIQTNVPSILGYKDHLTKDKIFLKNSVSSVKDRELKKIITLYLKQKN